MAKLTRLGDLERAVMDHLWSRTEPQTVRQVHEALSARRDLAYTTVMTVLQRLAKKNLVLQIRDDRAHGYAPVHGRDELVAGLMVDALAQAEDSGSRQAALVQLRRASRCRRGGCATTCARRIGSRSWQSATGWRGNGDLRETNGVSALAFTILAVLLAGPTPALLARATWPLRAPRAAMVLWQAIALAAVLSSFSAGIAIASRLLMPGPDGRPTTSFVGAAGRLGWPLWAAYITVFALTVLVGARLAVAVVRVATATRRRRAHHRMVVDLVGVGHNGALAQPCARARDLRVLDVAQPLAYCLPGVRSRVVVSEGTLTALADAEVAAILTHERAHLRARHDLVLEAFTAVHAAFPRLVRSANALGAVQLLVELLADDAAVRAAGRTPLARALVACASGRAPSGALAVGGPSTVLRVRRLSGRGNSAVLSAAAYLAAAAVLVVPTVALAVPWLTQLQRLFIA